MNDRKSAPRGPTGALGTLLLSCLLATGCGAGVQGAPSANALTARIDHVESENADLSSQLKDMSQRITELENLVLKQINEIKKLKVAQAQKPKTLSPAAVAQEPDTPAWDAEPILASAEEPWEDQDVEVGEQDGDDEEPRPLLKLYGTPEPTAQPVAPSTDGVKVTPASLLTDTSAIGGFVPLTIPSLDQDVPTLDDALAQGGGSSKTKTVDPYEQGVLKYEAKEWSSAILYFDLHLKHDPKSSKSLNALFLKAECLYQMKNYLEAIGQFELVMKRYPGSSRAASALLRIGRCYEKLGDKTKATSVYQELILDYPGTSQATKAAKLLETLK